MKVTLIFSDTGDASALKGHSVKTQIEMQDAVAALLDGRERVLLLSEQIGQFTRAALFITCPELGLKEHPIKMTVDDENLHTGFGIYELWKNMYLCFESSYRDDYGTHREPLDLRIIAPIICPFGSFQPPSSKRTNHKSLRHYLLHRIQLTGQVNSSDEAARQYAQRLEKLAEEMLALLRVDSPLTWEFVGFHARWWDNQAWSALQKINRQAQSARRKS